MSIGKELKICIETNKEAFKLILSDFNIEPTKNMLSLLAYILILENKQDSEPFMHFDTILEVEE